MGKHPKTHLRPWKPGQSGNPGGRTSEQRRLEMENAEAATRIRNRMLRSLEAKLAECDTVQALEQVKSEILKLLKDAEDRGLGTPRQAVDMTTAGEPIQPPSVIVFKAVEPGGD